MASHTEASYNKNTVGSNGTLVGNWAEERTLREFTGVGRSIMRQHIPKKHLDFETPIVDKSNSDPRATFDRIYGDMVK